MVQLFEFQLQTSDLSPVNGDNGSVRSLGSKSGDGRGENKIRR
jgi:hypothetical protein